MRPNVDAVECAAERSAVRADAARNAAELAQRDAEIVRKNAELIRRDAEIVRLRAENRALLNSILGIAGIPPVFVDIEARTQGSRDAGNGFDVSLAPRHHSERGSRTDDEMSGRAHANGGSGNIEKRSLSRPDDGLARNDSTRYRKSEQGAAPVRRRSWHQVNRALEVAAARKKEPAYRDDDVSSRDNERPAVIVPRIAQ